MYVTCCAFTMYPGVVRKVRGQSNLRQNYCKHILFGMYAYMPTFENLHGGFYARRHFPRRKFRGVLSCKWFA